jgi:TetR/AcrR family transcriptional repressor of nem operon
VFSTWEAEIAELLDEAKSVGEVDSGLDTKEAAAFLIDSFEGMLVRLKVDCNRSALRRFQRMALEPLGITKRA